VYLLDAEELCLPLCVLAALLRELLTVLVGLLQLGLHIAEGLRLLLVELAHPLRMYATELGAKGISASVFLLLHCFSTAFVLGRQVN
jgi:hypothetical protein